MFWLLGAYGRLKRMGVLGINRRNAACILDHNLRSRFPIVDDKLRMHGLCREIGVPTLGTYGVVTSHAQLCSIEALLEGRDDFVIKPNRGSAGRGVLVIVERDGQRFVRHNGQTIRLDQIRQHLSDVLSGMYSLGARPDKAIVQQRIRVHPAFVPLAYQGIPDVRVVVYRNNPAMAMLRLPTRASNGRANLHQGGVGVGVHLASGWTHHAVYRNRSALEHPDTGAPLIGFQVPFWRSILDMSRRVAEAAGLGYIGVDIVVDREDGPMLLEANARPGLAIQLANGQGLTPRLTEIDALVKRREKTDSLEEPLEMPLPQPLRKSA